MKNFLKRIIAVSLCFCMLCAVSVNASAATMYSSGVYVLRGRNNNDYVLNIYKDGQAAHGDAVKAYTFVDGDNNQHWLCHYSSEVGYYYLVHVNANPNLALASAGNPYNAVVEAINETVYGSAQQHSFNNVSDYYYINNVWANKTLTLTENRNGGIINYQNKVNGIWSQQWKAEYLYHYA